MTHLVLVPHPKPTPSANRFSVLYYTGSNTCARGGLGRKELWHFGPISPPPLKGRIGYCIVTRPFLTQWGQWSGNETGIGCFIVTGQWGQWSRKA